MERQGNNIILGQATFLLNVLAMGVAVQILEQESTFTAYEWQVFLQRHAQEQYDSMSQLDREIYIKTLVDAAK